MDFQDKYQKVRTHIRENKKVYLVGAGGVTAGALGMFFATGGYVQIVDGVKLIHIQYKSPNINIALVKQACREPIPVLDKTTGVPYPSIRYAAKMLGLTPNEISKDLHGVQDRFEELSESVFA